MTKLLSDVYARYWFLFVRCMRNKSMIWSLSCTLSLITVVNFVSPCWLDHHPTGQSEWYWFVVMLLVRVKNQSEKLAELSKRSIMVTGTKIKVCNHLLKMLTLISYKINPHSILYAVCVHNEALSYYIPMTRWTYVSNILYFLNVESLMGEVDEM